MKRFFLFGLLAIFFSFSAYCFQSGETSSARRLETNQFAGRADGQTKPVVLVELFTAESCPSCPPADRNLAFLEKEQPFQQAEIVTLALHVDYSNSQFRRDKFASSVFTRRQDIYAQKFQLGTTYTPQMIVDGEAQFAGGSLSKAQKAILEAAKAPKAKIEIARAEDKFNIKIRDLPKHGNTTVFLAIAEDELASNVVLNAATSEKREYISVVRELKSLGMIGAEQKNLEVEFVSQLQPGWKKENLKFIVFVQENESRKVLGASKVLFE